MLMDIKIVKLVKQYGERTVVDIEKFNFKEPGLYVILGLNGSGKSTFLESIANVNNSNNGVIKYDNRNYSEVRNRISMLLQKPYIFNGSVKDNLIKGSLLNKKDWKESFHKYTSYINEFNIENLMNKNAKNLSGGEKSMVAVALIMAIFMFKPSPFTFFDEIEAALDESNTKRLLKKLKEFTDKSQFILITHNKHTMKESDQLYGVTMNKEIGESKILSVVL